MSKLFVRNVSVRKLLDDLFVSAVGTVLAVRAFLYITDYPSIGGDSLHFAHMLWGGLLMVAALVILLAFLGQRVQHVGAVLGGIGFGLFIDELGKFITRDNNYFFQPTIMLIYLIFVGFYFVIRELDKTIELTEEEKLVNALELSKEAVMKRFDEQERGQMIALLSGSSQLPLVAHLRQLLDATVVEPAKKIWWPRQRAKSLYWLFVKSRYFTSVTVSLLLIQGVLVILSLVSFGDFVSLGILEQSIVMIGVGSAVVSAGLVLAGLMRLRTNRLLAFQKFYRANLVSVLVTQPFAFYVATFIPVLALAISLGAMATLQYVMAQETRRLHEKV